MKSLIGIMSLCLLSAFAQAEHAEPANCKSDHAGHVIIKVERTRWLRADGDYSLHSDLACKSQTSIPVLLGSASGCTYPILLSCEIELDGTKQKLNVSGLIYHEAESGIAKKYFTAGYHLDRNKGEGTTGEASSGQISTKDLKTQTVSLNLQSKLDSPISGMPMRDSFDVTIDFEDSDAQ